VECDKGGGGAGGSSPLTTALLRPPRPQLPAPFIPGVGGKGRKGPSLHLLVSSMGRGVRRLPPVLAHEEGEGEVENDKFGVKKKIGDGDDGN
jgi:hypothetical protein